MALRGGFLILDRGVNFNEYLIHVMLDLHKIVLNLIDFPRNLVSPISFELHHNLLRCLLVILQLLVASIHLSELLLNALSYAWVMDFLKEPSFQFGKLKLSEAFVRWPALLQTRLVPFEMKGQMLDCVDCSIVIVDFDLRVEMVRLEYENPETENVLSPSCSFDRKFTIVIRIINQIIRPAIIQVLQYRLRRSLPGPLPPALVIEYRFIDFRVYLKAFRRVHPVQLNLREGMRFREINFDDNRRTWIGVTRPVGLTIRGKHLGGVILSSWEDGVGCDRRGFGDLLAKTTRKDGHADLAVCSLVELKIFVREQLRSEHQLLPDLLTHAR